MTHRPAEHNARSNIRERRSFLRATAAATLVAGLPARAFAQDGAQDDNAANGDGLPIRAAGYPYERVRALQDGRVKVDGVRLQFETDKISPMNQHVLSGPQTRDVSEIGLIPFLLAFCNGEFRDYLLLPIFVLKMFRHKSIFVHADRGITKPADLRGRKVATVGYSSSGLTWIRGVIQDEYGVKPEEIKWVATTKDSSAQVTGATATNAQWERVLPKDIRITKAPAGVDESQLLLSGQVDAIFHPAEPQAYVDRHPKVRRLFSDARSVEQAYFKKTGIFPIMHAVAIRAKLVKEQPWLPKALFQAYCKAKQLDYLESRKIRWAYNSLPWYGQEYDETVKVMGANFYSYGVPQNLKALKTVFRYLHEQGLAKRVLTVNEVFAPSTLSLRDA